jgi:2-polyprenyl-3-methyl-5-hydroxy-6-metoxy-1,4-benzoquinol methylase
MQRDMRRVEEMNAAERWAQALAAWAIPPAILAAAPELPWGFPTEVFERRADALPAEPTSSTQRALQALPQGGSVLDVGCGAGAASLPLAARAGHLVGVDSSAAMLRAFRQRVEAAGKAVTTMEGPWPAVAEQTPVADVVVCHHVAYNVPDLAPFVQRLTDHARARVVMELTAQHPMSVLNDLWWRFHGLVRPSTPTADDAVAVLREVGLTPERLDWQAPALGWFSPFTRRADLVAWVRRRLCLPQERDGEIEAALSARILERDGCVGLPPRPVVTLWWSGAAP